MNPTEFLRARIAGDEAVARAILQPGHSEPSPWRPVYAGESSHCGTDATEDGLLIDPARLLAECAAKRGMIEVAFNHAAMVDNEIGCAHSVEQIKAGECQTSLIDVAETLAPILAIYADHPDFNPKWLAPPESHSTTT